MQEKSTKPARLATRLCPDRAQALIGEILYKVGEGKRNELRETE